MNALGAAKLTEVTQLVWGSILGWSVATGDGPSYAPPQEHLVGCVQITGDWEGAVTVRCSHNLAVDAAAEMFDIGSHEVQHADIHDALAELTNMVAGNLKAIVAKESLLSLPSVMEGNAAMTVKVPGTDVMSEVALNCRNEPMGVALHTKASVATNSFAEAFANRA